MAQDKGIIIYFVGVIILASFCSAWGLSGYYSECTNDYIFTKALKSIASKSNFDYLLAWWLLLWTIVDKVFCIEKILLLKITRSF